jgi:hypothetical protein
LFNGPAVQVHVAQIDHTPLIAVIGGLLVPIAKPITTTKMNRYSIPLIVLSLLAGCATAPPPPLTSDNPASPSAPEATVRHLRNSLGADDLTRESRQILAKAAEQQQRWDQSVPVSGDQQGQQMQNMPGMQMPKQQASPTPTPQQHQTDQMPGMQMPQEQSQPSPTPNN